MAEAAVSICSSSSLTGDAGRFPDTDLVRRPGTDSLLARLVGFRCQLLQLARDRAHNPGSDIAANDAGRRAGNDVPGSQRLTSSPHAMPSGSVRASRYPSATETALSYRTGKRSRNRWATASTRR